MKEKRLGYIDLLGSEFKTKLQVKVTVSGGVELDLVKSKKAAQASLKEAVEEICVGKKGAVYEVILRKVT
jgi:hypothetical protein